MTDRPILFSAPMIRALLAGTKTQTRRTIKPTRQQMNEWAPNLSICPSARISGSWIAFDHPGGGPYTCVPVRFAVGDRLWVRESYFQTGHWEPVENRLTKSGRQKWKFVPTGDVVFDPPTRFRKGRHNNDPGKVMAHQRLGRFMPRAASRLTLTVTDVRVERLQEISEADAIAEGIYRLGGLYCHSRPGDRFGSENAISVPAGWDQAIYAYQALWDRINGAGAWDANPWVVAVSFDVRRGNIDEPPHA